LSAPRQYYANKRKMKKRKKGEGGEGLQPVLAGEGKKKKDTPKLLNGE